jgi:DNA-binding NarL/FixJ family response regulator
MPIRVVLADDHPLILDGLVQLLRLAGDFEVLERCVSGEETLLALERQLPDLLVLDLRMPGLDGLAVLREMRRRQFATRVVILTAALSESDLLEAVRLGVRGVILKEMAPRLLLQCLRKVHAGGHWVENRAVRDALETVLRREAGAREAAALLTQREIELVRMVAQGLRNREIAGRLHITEGTVKTHLRNVYRKLELENRVGVRAYAEEKGLI